MCVSMILYGGPDKKLTGCICVHYMSNKHAYLDMLTRSKCKGKNKENKFTPSKEIHVAVIMYTSAHVDFLFFFVSEWNERQQPKQQRNKTEESKDTLKKQNDCKIIR